MHDISRPYGTCCFEGSFLFYQYLVPPELSRMGQNIGREVDKRKKKAPACGRQASGTRCIFIGH